MRRLRQGPSLALGLVGLALLAAGCEGGAAPPYRKAGADRAQVERDWEDCRTRVDSYLAKDRGIDADRQATVPGSAPRQQMDGNSDRRRSGRLLRDCMLAKGYSGGEADRGGIRW